MAPLDDSQPHDAVPRRPRPLAIAAPFAVLSATVATFGVGALCHAGRGYVRVLPIWFAPPLAAALFAGLGAGLGRWSRLEDPMMPYRGALAVALAAAGGCAGFLVCVLVDKVRYLESYLLWSMLLAVVMLPAWFAITAAAVRAVRERARSMIARAERRSAWSATLLACAIVAAPMMSMTLSRRHDCMRHPMQQLVPVIELALLLALGLLALRDARATVRLESIDLGAFRPLASDGQRADERGALDVGGGGERWTRTAHFVGYRGPAARSVALRGDPWIAIEALRACSARSRRAVAVCAGVIAMAALIGYASRPCGRARSRVCKGTLVSSERGESAPCYAWRTSPMD